MARRWFDVFEGAGLDGLIAKPADLPYEPGKRLMSKVKHARTADAVVAGFRWHKSGPVVGSLLLGLYDDAGVLHHVGVSASFTMARRAELLEELAPYRDVGPEHPWVHGDHERGQRIPGGSAGGPAPRTWNGSRCARNSWSRWRTTRWRVTGSGTPRASFAGDPTVTRSPADTINLTGRSGSTWTRCCGVTRRCRPGPRSLAVDPITEVRS